MELANYTGAVVEVVASGLTHATHSPDYPVSGDAVVVDAVVGVALLSAAAATDIVPVAAEGVFELPVTAVTATANSAVAVGDKLYFADADVKAKSTLTSDATEPGNGDVVSIGDIDYTFRTALTEPAEAYEVLIGASAAAALDNLKAAITAGAGAGTLYGTGTEAHPLATATTNTNTTQVVEALAAGSDGNGIAVAAVSDHLSWGSASLVGGVVKGDLTKTGTKTGFGVALDVVPVGDRATIDVIIKRNH